MFPPFVAFNPMDAEQRRYVRSVLDAADISYPAPPLTEPATPPTPVTPAAQPAITQPAQVIRKLPRILRLASGQLLVLASQHYGPGQHFDMKDLALKTGLDVKTILSKNRTLGNSMKKRQLQKSWVLHEHGGWPKKFSIPASIHAEIIRITAQATTPATPATATA